MEFSQLDNQIVKQSDQPVLADFSGEGRVLVVTFAAYAPKQFTPFEFYGRLKKIEQISGCQVNKILVRDLSNSWYHYGVPGFGRDIAEAVSRLKAMISEMSPSRVITLGQSMGAFGAVLYGSLLDVDAVIAFGPLAVFDLELFYYFSEHRWSDVVKRVASAPPPVFYRDLPRLIDSLSIRTRFHVYYGTKPTGDPSDKLKWPGAVHYDAVHGCLYSRCARVEAHPVRWSEHRVPLYLRKVGFIDELMLHRVLDIPYSPESFADLPVPADWINWMETDYALGYDGEVMLPRVRLTGDMTAAAVSTAFGRVRRNVLRRKL
jgi:hypothetical protein